MSWADKQLKKHKLRKQIKEIMDSPEFQKERQKELDKHTAEAMNCFLLISVDYLYRNYHCKRKGVFEISGICFTPDAFCTEGRRVFSADE